MLAVTAPEPSVRSVPEQVKVAAVALPPWVHGTEQDLTASCRPLTGSVVRTLGVATVVLRATVASAEEPSLTRLTARVSESPGTKPAVVTGTVKPCWVTSIERVPDWIVVFTGVLLSVKVPKVPMPATAAAVPRTPRVPTTLRAVGLSVRARMLAVLMAADLPCVRFVDRGSGDKDDSGGRSAGHPRAFRKESAR